MDLRDNDRTQEPGVRRDARGADAAARYAPPAALAVVLAGLALPKEGWGFPLCWVKQWTGYPCLSCGLTRSFLHTLQGDWAGGLLLHPLGPLLALLCLVVAAAGLLPGTVRRRAARQLTGPTRWTARLALAVLTVLAINGVYRLWWIWGLGRPSPW